MQEGMDEFDLAESLQVLNKCRVEVWIILLVSLLLIPAMTVWKTSAFSMVLLALTWLGGVMVVSHVGRAMQLGGVEKIVCLLVTMTLVLTWMLMIYLLLRLSGRSRLLAQQQARLQVQRRKEEAAARAQRAQRAAATTPPSRPANKAAQWLATVIPQVRIAGLSGLANGQRLEAKITAPGVDVPASEQPLLMVQSGSFGVAYLFDQGDSYGYVTLGQVKAAGISDAELHGKALANLLAMTERQQRGLRLHKMSESCGLTLDGQFEASLVLVDELWTETVKSYAPNGAVMCIPSRDVCAFCDAKSAAGIAQLKAVAEKVSANGQHLLSEALFIRSSQGWQAL